MDYKHGILTKLLDKVWQFISTPSTALDCSQCYICADQECRVRNTASAMKELILGRRDRDDSIRIVHPISPTCKAFELKQQATQHTCCDCPRCIPSMDNSTGSTLQTKDEPFVDAPMEMSVTTQTGSRDSPQLLLPSVCSNSRRCATSALATKGLASKVTKNVETKDATRKGYNTMLLVVVVVFVIFAAFVIFAVFDILC
jgi:hypothetical protein